MNDQPAANPTPAGASDASLLIVIPVFDDWACAAVLLERLDFAFKGSNLDGRFLLVDDGSPTPCPRNMLIGKPEIAAKTDLLELRRNLGHQRAIAIGLAYVQAQRSETMIVVMDGDGEDDPADVPRLVAKFNEEGGRKIVFAERRKRSESALFVLFYHLYRTAHVILTGHKVRVGNFSIIPRASLDRLVVVAELWNHYAASVFRTRLPWASIPTTRSQRITGQSKMNFVSLVVHGLSAISVYSEIVGVRVLTATGLLIALTLAGIVGVVGIRLFTNSAIAGWATTAAGLLLVVLMQAVMISLVFIFSMLNNRQAATFLPIRDYSYFVARARPLGDGR